MEMLISSFFKSSIMWSIFLIGLFFKIYIAIVFHIFRKKIINFKAKKVSGFWS